MEKLIINAALTGNIPTRDLSPYVPLSIEEIVKDAVDCANSGVSVVHIHARDTEGNPTHEKEVFRKIIGSIREKCPELIICATTSGRRYNEIEKRAMSLISMLDEGLIGDIFSRVDTMRASP